MINKSFDSQYTSNDINEKKVDQNLFYQIHNIILLNQGFFRLIYYGNASLFPHTYSVHNSSSSLLSTHTHTYYTINMVCVCVNNARGGGTHLLIYSRNGSQKSFASITKYKKWVFFYHFVKHKLFHQVNYCLHFTHWSSITYCHSHCLSVDTSRWVHGNIKYEIFMW